MFFGGWPPCIAGAIGYVVGGAAKKHCTLPTSTLPTLAALHCPARRSTVKTHARPGEATVHQRAEQKHRHVHAARRPLRSPAGIHHRSQDSGPAPPIRADVVRGEPDRCPIKQPTTRTELNDKHTGPHPHRRGLPTISAGPGVECATRGVAATNGWPLRWPRRSPDVAASRWALSAS